MSEIDNSCFPTASIDTLKSRAEFTKRVRKFFDDRGFFEVETPQLSQDTVVDRNLEPIGLSLNVAGAIQQFWLQTSPEFGMKRLLSAGATAIYQITRAFRAGEFGSMHNPEFTMLEWYRAGDSYQEGVKFLCEFCVASLETPPPKLITFRQLYQEFLSVDPFSEQVSSLKDTACKFGLGTHPDENLDRDQLLQYLLAHCIEPKIAALPMPFIVYDWPASQSALAVVRDEEFPIAERFELYVAGVELANGYHELTDPAELARRNKNVNAQRVADGNPALPEHSRMIEAMKSGLPNCCGVAVGFDRLFMLAEKLDSVRDVIAFPIDRA